jgi:hypothetical protein
METSSADDWTCSFLELRRVFVAEMRPPTRGLGLVSGVGILCTLVAGTIGWISANEGFLVLAILSACITAFPLALWLGMRRSFWRITLDFEASLVCIEEQRSFDNPLRFDSSIEEIFLEKGPGSSIRLRWRSDAGTEIHIPFPTDEQAHRTLAQLQQWLHLVSSQM